MVRRTAPRKRGATIGSPRGFRPAMTSRTFTFTLTACTIGIAACWTVGLSLAIADIFIVPNLGAVAVAFLIGGGVLTVCRELRRHDHNWTEAYEAGKEVGVRRLRDRV